LRVALATCNAFPDLSPDDLPLRDALAARGVEPVPAVWDDGAVEWARFDACVLRSVWDYHLQHERFVAWLRRLRDWAVVWNPVELAIWNSHKSYLRELAEAGVPTVPTHWLERGSETRLADLLDSLGWEEAVVKPAVDLGALRLHRVARGDSDGQANLQRLLAGHDVMVQPFLPSLESRGETSLVYVAGELSHAVRKRPRDGDFRVQPRWGGSAERVDPEDEEVSVAERALARLDQVPLYARVDLVEGEEEAPCLIELELIDPLLFLERRPAAAEAIAESICARLSG
jgi:glutathione synthase/RimK-type ligase-like ATP-grasp enzyme